MAELSEGIPVVSVYELLDSLAEPLRVARERKDCASRRSAQSFSALAYFDNNETKQTQIIASLLNPNERHAQGTLFLRQLLAKVWPSTKPSDWPEDDLQRAKVYSNHFISSGFGSDKKKRFIDLWIRVGEDLCLAIESKAKDADDQPDQIGAYLNYMKSCCSSLHRYKLLYLPLDGAAPCDKSISSAEWDRACHDGIAELQPYVPFVRRWLETCKEECEASRIKFFIEDLLTFADPNDRRTSIMPQEMDSEVRELLLGTHPVDPRSKTRRDTLLSIWEIADQIYMEVLRVFQNNFCERLTVERIEYKLGDEDGILSNRTEWSGFIKGTKSDVIARGKQMVVYTEIQRCKAGSHGTSRPHLIIGIHIEGLEEKVKELKPWRELAASKLGPGTRDANWVWQEIPPGFEDLHSKDTAMKLLDPQWADEIVNRMQDVLKTFADAVRETEQ
jgi:hypothetical protein